MLFRARYEINSYSHHAHGHPHTLHFSSDKSAGSLSELRFGTVHTRSAAPSPIGLRLHLQDTSISPELDGPQWNARLFSQGSGSNLVRHRDPLGTVNANKPYQGSCVNGQEPLSGIGRSLRNCAADLRARETHYKPKS